MMTDPKRTYFISSGRLNAMYTLRVHTIIPAPGVPDQEHYICNLSTDPVKAERKAREWWERAGSPGVFAGFADWELNRRGEGGSKGWQIDAAENGVFPFGKYRGQEIAEIFETDPDYIVYWGRLNDASTKAAEIVRDKCRETAKAIIEREDAERAERERQRIEAQKSQTYFGEVGDRFERKVHVDFVTSFEGFYGTTWITKMVDDAFRATRPGVERLGIAFAEQQYSQRVAPY